MKVTLWPGCLYGNITDYLGHSFTLANRVVEV